MRGGLDETLARLARREEARRRRSADPETDDGGDPVEEVAEAVRRVVAARPGLTVVLRVEYAGRTYPLRIEQAQPAARNERPEVGTRAGVDPPAAPPPAWPLADRTPPAWTPAREVPGVDPAARLAELIRRDPTLLDNDT
ncbi:hypothetical protein [Micromonospora sp. HUAS LYJ1]|uniref:hypothetical protein n=1 Tax=Micromonospora sp. HUAS LYJ1 TaxID=3061626 RepID=UPI0026719B23|nr:hypothetical protein [Micromonospora sp. HUAS LYJ1]WKU02702.1 hypothetical protein Q2K16_17445 [Micromonospora sp. HUAS LYJ1]